MLTYSDRGFPTTIEINDGLLWHLYYSLRSVRDEFEDATKSGQLSVVSTGMKKNGIEYQELEIIEALGNFNDYISKSGADSSAYDRSQALDIFEQMLETNFLEIKIHKITMEFKIWAYILTLFDVFKPIESDDCQSDDWTPPETFACGTDDEREVLESFTKK